MNTTCTNWDSVLPSILFAINNSQHSTTGYSPFEVIYGFRLRFLLTHIASVDDNIPGDVTTYLSSKHSAMELTLTMIKERFDKVNAKMIVRLNKGRSNLQLHKDDYVFMTHEATGPGGKLKDNYSGPYVVMDIVSDHMVNLQDHEHKRQFPHPIHIDRLKPAHIRCPSPANFFRTAKKRTFRHISAQTDIHVHQNRDTVDNFPASSIDSGSSSASDSSSPANQKPTPVSTRPKRVLRKPARFCDSDHVDPNDLPLPDTIVKVKVKRILAQRHTMDGLQYLVQLVGEPTQA
ncbi:uncharacterized protein [Argopecten irradians]|uniref:uncharacterized protein n=1 Tax=Argopecten irradians TaxID=31199 RepID=UPI003723F3A2